MLELVAVDGTPLPAREEQEQETRMSAQMQALCDGQARIVSMLLSQQAEIARLAKALSTVRITRTQELAIQSAIRRRAAELATAEGMPKAAAKRIASAIRVTLREATGVRAVGDLQAAQFERAMDIATAWRMEGALRRIRKGGGA